MTITSGMMSSATDDWATPQALFDILNNEFHFTLDVCATAENAKCDQFYTKAIDGLAQDWRGTCWMNPPYGRDIIRWVRKAAETANTGGGRSCLLGTSQNRYALVATLRHASVGNPAHRWPRQIRGFGKLRAVPVCCIGFRNSAHTNI